MKEAFPVEGDLILAKCGSIFDVKGLIHPTNRIIAFLRYFPAEEGEREKDGVAYGKVYSLSERYALLRKRLPQYLTYDPVFDETLCEVPAGDVKKHYIPVEKLHELRTSKRLDELENQALQSTKLLKERANIPWSSIGISGSVLAGLHTSNSDIDLIVYGSENCWRVHSVLEDFLNEKDGPFRSYDREDLNGLFEFRSKDSAADFESFVRTESRKVIQGRYAGKEYFIRFVKNRAEIDEKYGDVQYRNLGVAKIKATIADDSEAIFTPCVYKIENVQILDGSKVGQLEEIVSFRGRFCEQARTGEAVIAQGKIEHVADRRHSHEYHRLLLGNKPSDCMILA